MTQPDSEQSTAVRDARIAIWGTVLFGPFGRIMMMATLFTWRSWREKPAWFWKPFTIASLVIAAIVGSCWPMLGGDGIYKSVMGHSYFDKEPQLVGVANPNPIALAMITCSFWSLALLPHSFARIGWLIVQRIRSRAQPPEIS